jgi:hypothetical protein
MDGEETSGTQLPANDDKFWSFPFVIHREIINFKNWFSNAGNQSPSIRLHSIQLLRHRKQSVTVSVCGLFRAPRIPELIREPRIFDSYRRSDVIYFDLWRVTPLSELVRRNTTWLPKWFLYLPHALTLKTTADFDNPRPWTEHLNVVTKPTITQLCAGAYAPARKLSTNLYDIYHCWMYSE